MPTTYIINPIAKIEVSRLLTRQAGAHAASSTDEHSRITVAGWTFSVQLFHLLLHAGLSRRYLPCPARKLRITGWQRSPADLPARVDAVVIFLFPRISYCPLFTAINTRATENAFLIFHDILTHHFLYWKTHRAVFSAGVAMLTDIRGRY